MWIIAFARGTGVYSKSLPLILSNQDIDAGVEVWSFVSKFDMMGLIGCNSTNHFNIDIVNSKSLIRIVDLLGRESKDFNSKPLFYIYDDGTVEKKIIIE